MFVHGEELSDQRSAHTRILLSKQINYISDFSGLNFTKERGGKGRFRGFVGSAGVGMVRLEPKTGLVWC